MNKDNYKKLVLSAGGITLGYSVSSLLNQAGVMKTNLVLFFWIGLCVGAGLSYFICLWQLTSDKYTRTKLAISMILGTIIGLSIFIAIIIYIIQTTPTYL